jgi:hypothetical protein
MKQIIRISTIAIAIGFAGLSAAQTAQPSSLRLSTPIGSYERSTHSDSVEIAIPPVFRHQVSTTYASGRAAYDSSYNATMDSLRNNRAVANNASQLRTTTSTTGVGVSHAGFGVERATSTTSVRSAQEDANHMWQRTQHLRDLQSATAARGRVGGASRNSQ